MKAHQLLGSKSMALRDTAALLEQVLGKQFVLHDSDYRGGEYFRLEYQGVTLMLQRNFEDEEGALSEPSHQDVRLLLYLDGEVKSVDVMSLAIVGSAASFRLLREDTN